MKSFSRFAVIAALLSAAIVAPLASAIGNGALSKPARFESEVAVVAQDKPMLIEFETMLIAASAPARKAAPVARKAAQPVRADRVLVTELEQGGRPGAGSVVRFN